MRWSDRPQPFFSLLSTLIWGCLIVIGWIGNSDPLANLLPLVVWTLFWVALTLVQACLGNWWAWLNPWSGIIYLLRRMGSSLGSRARLTLPAKLGYLPGIMVFVAFAWFELVSLAPEDPQQLAMIVAAYWLFTLMAIMIFGEKDWLERGEAFAIFFRFISKLSPLSIERTRPDSPIQSPILGVALPATRLIQQPALHWSGAIFILTTLATVSFDGLNKTFWWLHVNGINPLAFAGRSSVGTINTVGLLGACATLVFLYCLSVAIGWRWQYRASVPAVKSIKLSTAIGSFALAIMPISLAYHAAHYLTQLLVNSQYLLKSLSDPLGTDADFFGTSTLQVTTSFLSHHHAVELLWKLQVLIIVLGHIASVIIAHGVALRLCNRHTAAVRSQGPLGVLMVAYTLFGLWLLSTPTGL